MSLSLRKVCSLVAVGGCMVCALLLNAQGGFGSGHSIGKVTTQGNLVVLTLNKDVLGEAHLFDLAHRTLHFTPGAAGYRIENGPEHWDPQFGTALSGSSITLNSFGFPFSGKVWNKLSVGMTGSIVFGDGPAKSKEDREGGLTVDRFAELAEAGPSLVNIMPAISAFFKPRLSGKRYVKELPDRVVITWDLSEPVGGIQDMTWTPTTNRFQAVLFKNGSIDLSYDEVHAEDAIVGVYPVLKGKAERVLADLPVPSSAPVALTDVRLTTSDGVVLKAMLTTRDLQPIGHGTAQAGLSFRVCISHAPNARCDLEDDVQWTAQRSSHDEGPNATPHYYAYGSGVTHAVEVAGTTMTLQGTLPAGFKPGDLVFVSVHMNGAGTGKTEVEALSPHAVKLRAVSSPAVTFSSIKKAEGPFPVAYEVFHYMHPPRAEDLTCSVIQALGDKFDMLAYYSDFRIDNPEAGTSSTGPLGGGPAGGAVIGIGAEQENLAGFCTKGRFQWQFIQPVYVGANQMQEYPPDGLNEANKHNVAGYTGELEERTDNGKIPPYDYAISQIGHEMGHRWSAFVSAKVHGEVIPLGPTHWARGLQAQVAFPYQRPTEASAMGGGVWQDNFDGTFTQLDDDYYVPATGWSYLDLYLMGMISPAEVPDFFLLRNLLPTGHDVNGHLVVKADRTRVTINDVIAQEGPRLPAVREAQKKFNTGMVVVVEQGKTPSPELIKAVTGIRERWIDYWTTTTGHRSTMTADPH